MINEVVGNQSTFTAVPLDTTGLPIPYNEMHSVTWLSDAPAVASITGTGIDYNAQEVALSVGVANITVTVTDENGNTVASAAVQVTVSAAPPPTVASVSITVGPIS